MHTPPSYNALSQDETYDENLFKTHGQEFLSLFTTCLACFLQSQLPFSSSSPQNYCSSSSEDDFIYCFSIIQGLGSCPLAVPKAHHAAFLHCGGGTMFFSLFYTILPFCAQIIKHLVHIYPHTKLMNHPGSNSTSSLVSSGDEL